MPSTTVSRHLQPQQRVVFKRDLLAAGAGRERGEVREGSERESCGPEVYRDRGSSLPSGNGSEDPHPLPYFPFLPPFSQSSVSHYVGSRVVNVITTPRNYAELRA